MNEKYFDQLGHIKCANGDPDYLKLNGLQFRLEAKHVEQGYEVTLCVFSEAKTWTRKFERLLTHAFSGLNCCEGGMSPKPDNRELLDLAEKKGLTAKEAAARAMGNTMVRNGAKLAAFHTDHSEAESLEFVLSFPSYLDSVRIPISVIPEENFSYDAEAAVRDLVEDYVAAHGDQ